MDLRLRLLLMLAAMACLFHAYNGRTLIDETISDQDLVIKCNNTIQGPHLLADSQGYVCTARNIDYERGCCPEEGQQFSCLGCNSISQCCDTFEYCVSCCLDPMHTSKDRALRSKTARQLTAVNYGSVFEYCIGRCRHNSGSVIHENAYASEEHHCFFNQINSSVGDHRPSINEFDRADYSIIIGRRGQSCDEACRDRRLACKPSKLPLINKCSVIQKHMNCKGACISASGADLPSEIISTAPKHLHPGACLFNAKDTLLSCHGSSRQSKRLCPCG